MAQMTNRNISISVEHIQGKKHFGVLKNVQVYLTLSQ